MDVVGVFVFYVEDEVGLVDVVFGDFDVCVVFCVGGVGVVVWVVFE